MRNLISILMSLMLGISPAFAWNQASSKVIQADTVSGSDSGPNYWKTGDAEISISGVSVYNDGLVDKPVDCNGGSSTITATRSSTTPLQDKFSWLITKPASNVRGQGVAFEFDVDNGVAAVEMMDILFDYLVGSGTFVAGSNTTNSDLMVYLYDVTAEKLIEPTGGSKLYTSSTDLKGSYRGWFQSTLGSKKYRLCLHQALTGTSAYTLKVDAGKVQKSKQVVGTIITDWQNYTPIWTATTTNPTIGNGSLTGRWRRVGDSAEIAISTVFGSTTTTGSGSYRWSLPTGLVQSSTVTMNQFNGSSTFYDSSGSVNWEIGSALRVSSTEFGAYNLEGQLASTTTGMGGTSDSITLEFTLPIQGWSAGARMSDGYDGRVIAATLAGTPTGTIASAFSSSTTLNFPTVVLDGTASYSAGSITIKTSGTHKFSGTLGITVGTSASTNYADIAIYKNGSLLRTTPNSLTISAGTFNMSLPFVFQEELVAGDVITFRLQSGFATKNPYLSNVAIEKLSGAAFMSPTATVAEHWAGTDGAQAIGTSDSLIKFNTKVDSTHGAYNPATGIFTAPEAGRYSISWSVATVPVSLAVNQRMYANLNNSIGSVRTYGSRASGTGGSAQNYQSQGSITIYLNQGQTFIISSYSSVATTASTIGSECYLSIVKVAN